MADDVTRTEFDALSARVTTLETAAGGTKPTPPITPAATTATTPVVTVTGSTYTLSASITAAKKTTFTYLQLAVRGAGASDLARSPATTLAAGASKKLSATASGSGDYTAWVAWSIDGTTWVDGPKVSFSLPSTVVTPASPDTPTPDVIGHDFPLVNASGIGFNSLVFRQTVADAQAFGKRRGVEMDGLLYFPGRGSWNDFLWHPGGQADWLAQGRIVVTTQPHAPQSEGAAMNSKGANNAYATQQKALGKWLADNGFNQPSHVIRVDWECNGNWYPWNAGNGGPEALKAAIINYVKNLRAGGATKVKFNLCFNKGPSQAGHDFDVFPGGEYIDIVGIDEYDMWDAAFTAADWERQMAKSPSVRTVAEFAAKNGVLWAWDEGGNTHGSGSAYGGDNPAYWQFAYEEIQRNRKNNAYHVTYDDPGAPATLAHDFDHNPNSFTKYKSLWRPR